jgi:hypothetical protein
LSFVNKTYHILEGYMKLKVAAKSVKAPAKAPAKAVKAPAKAMKAPAKSAKAPAKSAKAPAKAVKAPAKAVKAPAKSAKAVKKPKAPKLLKWCGGHIEYDVKLLGIFTKYEKAIEHIDTVDFKSYTVILLNSLKEIIRNTTIDSEIAKLEIPTVLKDKQVKILSNIKQTYIDPYLISVRDENNNITGVIKTAEFTNNYAKKVKLDEEDEKIKKYNEWYKKQEKATAEYEAKVENEKFWKERAVANSAKYRGYDDAPTMYAKQRQNRVNTATEFGRTTYNVVRADIGVASRNSPVFNTK